MFPPNPKFLIFYNNLVSCQSSPQDLFWQRKARVSERSRFTVVLTLLAQLGVEHFGDSTFVNGEGDFRIDCSIEREYYHRTGLIGGGVSRVFAGNNGVF